MEKSKTSSIVKRIVTALILVPVTVGVLYAGYPYVQQLHRRSLDMPSKRKQTAPAPEK